MHAGPDAVIKAAVRGGVLSSIERLLRRYRSSSVSLVKSFLGALPVVLPVITSVDELADPFQFSSLSATVHKVAVSKPDLFEQQAYLALEAVFYWAWKAITPGTGDSDINHEKRDALAVCMGRVTSHLIHTTSKLDVQLPINRRRILSVLPYIKIMAHRSATADMLKPDDCVSILATCRTLTEDQTVLKVTASLLLQNAGCRDKMVQGLDENGVLAGLGAVPDSTGYVRQVDGGRFKAPGLCGNFYCSNLTGARDADLKLLVCAGCRKVWYCSRECQAAARPAHKPECKMDTA